MHLHLNGWVVLIWPSAPKGVSLRRGWAGFLATSRVHAGRRDLRQERLPVVASRFRVSGSCSPWSRYNGQTLVVDGEKIPRAMRLTAGRATTETALLIGSHSGPTWTMRRSWHLWRNSAVRSPTGSTGHRSLDELAKIARNATDQVTDKTTPPLGTPAAQNARYACASCSP